MLKELEPYSRGPLSPAYVFSLCLLSLFGCLSASLSVSLTPSFSFPGSLQPHHCENASPTLTLQLIKGKAIYTLLIPSQSLTI